MASQSQSILQTSLFVLLLGAFGYVCKIMYTNILTHNLSLELYGDFSVAWESLFLASQVLTFGSGISAQRFISNYVKEGKRAKKRSFINWLASMFLQSIGILVVVYTVFWLVAHAVMLPEDSIFDHYHLAALVIIFAPTLSLVSIGTSMVIAYGYPTLATFMATIIMQGGQLLAILVFFSVRSTKELMDVLYLITAILAVLTILSTIVLLSVPKNDIVESLSSKQKAQHHDDKWLTTARSACLNQIMFTLASTIDLYILEIFSPNESHVGLFGICCVCVGLLSTLIRVVNQQVVMKIMNVNEKNVKQNRALQNELDKYNMVKLTILIGCIAISWFYRVEIFSFFHVHTEEAYGLLPLMFMNVYLADNLYQFSYLMAKNEVTFLNQIEGLAVVLMTILALILVFPYNMYGVVLANTITRTIYKALMSYKARQTSSLRLNLLF